VTIRVKYACNEELGLIQEVISRPRTDPNAKILGVGVIRKVREQQQCNTDNNVDG